MYVLPDELRSELKSPMGPVQKGSFVDEVGEGPLATVGDVVTRRALSAGARPTLMVVDGITKRSEEAPEVDPGSTTREVEVDNPPARITDELWDAIEDAFQGETPTLIRVDGEEDLAVLPAIVHAPDGATVVYGQPDEGAVLVTVDQIARERANDLLARMEVV
jgi:uncharacterized protein (UPF0218 family)